MKLKRKIIVLLSAMTMLAGTYGAASANVVCNDATLTQVGVDPANVDYPNFVRMTCNDTSPVRFTDERTFYMLSSLGDSGLALALTALTADINVKVHLSSFNTKSLLQDIKLVK